MKISISQNEVIVQMYPHMDTHRCAAHILDVLLEDWDKDQRIKRIVAWCKAIVKFMKKYHVTLALFRKYLAKKALRLSSAICFKVHFFMIDSLVKCKQALHNETYMPFEKSLVHWINGTTIRLSAHFAKEDIHSKVFWCKNF